MSVRKLPLLVIAACLPIGAAAAWAQAPAGYSPSTGFNAQFGRTAGEYERISGRNNPALRYFGGATTAAYAAPSRPAVLPAPLPAPTAPSNKPFSGVQQAAAISPYLGLDAARESGTSLPNYFLYVRPQLEQQQMNQVQQAQFRKLQQQVRTAAAPGVATSPGGGLPTTGTSAQFMNSGSYYPALRR